MSDEKMCYTVMYMAKDSRHSIILPGGITIRSGASMAFATLPVSQKILEAMPGVTVNYIPARYAQEIVAEHPKAAYYKAVAAAKTKRERKR